MKRIFLLILLSSCSLFHQKKEFELEELSQDVLSSKSKEGISITIMPVHPK